MAQTQVIFSETLKGPHNTMVILTTVMALLAKVSFGLSNKLWISLILNLYNAHVMERGALYIIAMVDLVRLVRSLSMEVGVHSMVLEGPGGQRAIDYQEACLCTPIPVHWEVHSSPSNRCPNIGVAPNGSMKSYNILLQMK